jgi:hypothetical protein
MTDNDPLGLVLNDEITPGPDAATVARVFEQHQKMLDGINHLDPNNRLYFGRPDLATKARAEAQVAFEAIQARHGITGPPPPVTAEARAQAAFDTKWSLGGPPDHLVAEIEARATAGKEMSQARRDDAVVALKHQYGETRWAQLHQVNLQPNVPKATFVASEGARAHAELVRLAKVVMPNLPDALLADDYALSSLAGYGRYMLAKAAATTAMKGS